VQDDTHFAGFFLVLTDFLEVSKIACEQALWLAEKDAVECVHVIHTIFMDTRAAGTLEYRRCDNGLCGI
jgi:hypothetical protein